MISILLVAVTLAVYWQVASHDFVNFDDDVYVTHNAHVVTGLTFENIRWAFTSLETSHWHPVTMLSHQLDVQLFGLNPHGHHLTSVFIHALSAVLVLILFFRLTGALWQSAFVAAVFALHPLHVESVAWIAERKDVLSCFFWFLTLILYTEYARNKKFFYVLSLCSFVLGLMAKSMMITLPFVMLLLDFWPLSRFDDVVRSAAGTRLVDRISLAVPLVVEKIPYLAFSFVSLGVASFAMKSQGVMKSTGEVPVGLRLENVITSYAKYIFDTIAPFNLAVYYPLPSSIALWKVVVSLLVLAIITVAAIRCWRTKPYLAVGWFWYGISLLPVIGFVQLGGQSMADRYMYIPQTGLLIMLAWGLPPFLASSRYGKAIMTTLAGGAIIAMMLLTWHQLPFWRDSISLCTRAISVTSDNYLMHHDLANALSDKGDLDGALAEFEKALAINPYSVESHYNLGNTLAKKGDINGEIVEYQRALAINPNHVDALNNLGAALSDQGRIDEAIVQYTRALAVKPDYADAHVNLGLALLRKGAREQAIDEFSRALAINPNHAEARYNLQLALTNRPR